MRRPWLLIVTLCVLAVARPTAAALDDHGGPVKGVAVSADGRQALTASFDYSLILWDLERERVLQHLFGHDAAVNDVAFVPGGRAVSVSDDGTLAFWDLERGELLARLEAHRAKAVAVALSPDGRLAATAGWDRSVRLWDLKTRKPLHELRARDNPNDVAFTADGGRLVAGGSDGSLHVWRVADGTRTAEIRRHDFAITHLALGPENGLAATASVDETVQIWDLERGAVTGALYGHEGAVLAVALSPDAKLVASGGIDGTVRVWRRGDGDRLRVFERHRGPVWAVAFAPEGDVLLSGGADGLVLSHDLERADEPEASVPQAALGAAPDSDPGLGAVPESDPALGVAPGPDPLLEEAGRGQERGAELFRKCVACHTVTPDGGNRAGPTLYRIFGREAGGHPDYRYSDALEGSDLVWTEKTVAELFEIGPDRLVPGSKMPLQRMPSAEDRADLVDYLKRVSEPPDDE